MADNALQEVEIPFNGRKYRVRPTYRILARIEAVTGQPVREAGIRAYASGVSLAQREGIKELRMSDVVAILGVILADVPDAPKPDQIGDILMDEGYIELMGPLGDFLTRAARGNKVYEQEIREKAEAAQKEGAAQADQDPPPPPPTKPEPSAA